MAWTDEARLASIEARRRHAKGKKPPIKIVKAVKEPSRSARAKATYKVMDTAKHRISDHGEALVHKMLGRGERIGGTQPMDIVVRGRRGLVGVEVKTLVDQTNDKITVHPESRRRKEKWARVNRARIFTIAVDVRSSRTVVYARGGTGAFRLRTMIRITSRAHLLELIDL